MTVKRKNRMFTRIHVPTSLQEYLGRKEITRTLRTQNELEAKLIDEDIQRQVKSLWQEASELFELQHRLNHNQGEPTPTADDLIEIIKNLVDEIVDRHLERFSKVRLEQYLQNPFQLTQSTPQKSNADTPVKEAPMWSVVAAEWLSEKELSLKASSIKDYRGYIPVMQEALGEDKPIASISRAEFTAAIKRLATMTSGHGKPFSQRSIEKYSLGFSMVCNYAVKAGYVDKNLCPAVSKKSKKGSGDKTWKPFTDGELASLQGGAGQSRSTEDHLRAITLTGLLSGLRLSEIVQLHLADLKTVDSILCFDINDDGDKELKSAASHRTVPVHPFLIPTLEEFKQQALNMGSTRLFPELSSPAVSKQLNRLIKKVADGPVFHSTRKRFAKALTDNGIDKNLIAALLGHSDDLSVTTIYTGKYPVKLLKQAVDSISYSFL